MTARPGWKHLRVGAGDNGLAVIGGSAVGQALEIRVEHTEVVRIRAVDRLAHPVDVPGVARVGAVEWCERRHVRVDDRVGEVVDPAIVACVGAAQHLKCRSVGTGELWPLT